MNPFDPRIGRYLAFLDALGQAAIATDLEGRVHHWSPAAETLFGWSREEALGRSIVELTPSPTSRTEAAAIMTALARGEVWTGEFELQKRDGAVFHASVTDVPLLAADGRLVGVAGVSSIGGPTATLAPVFARFAEACARVWPDQVRFGAPRSARLEVRGSESHLLQLLALLLTRWGDQLESGEALKVSWKKADGIFDQLGARGRFPAAYVRIGPAGDRAAFSLVKDALRGAVPTDYAAMLVRRVGGMLFEGALPNEPEALHLILPTP